MMEQLALLPWPVQLGAIGFLILTIVSILVYQNRLVQTGKLIPRDTHVDVVKRADQRAEDFKLLWETADKRGDVMEGVASDIVVIGENLDKVLKSIPAPPLEGRSS